jgi:hypothetical protein
MLSTADTKQCGSPGTASISAMLSCNLAVLPAAGATRGSFVRSRFFMSHRLLLTNVRLRASFCNEDISEPDKSLYARLIAAISSFVTIPECPLRMTLKKTFHEDDAPTWPRMPS